MCYNAINNYFKIIFQLKLIEMDWKILNDRKHNYNVEVRPEFDYTELFFIGVPIQESRMCRLGSFLGCQEEVDTRSAC